MSPPFLPLRRASPGPTGGRAWQLGEERMLASGHRLSDGEEGAWEGRWLEPHHQAAKLLGMAHRLRLGSFAPTTILWVTKTGVMILLLQRWGKLRLGELTSIREARLVSGRAGLHIGPSCSIFIVKVPSSVVVVSLRA